MRIRDLERPAHIQDAETEAVAQAQSTAELRNAMRRHMDRMGKFKDWVKPEAIAARLREHEEQAAAALTRAKEMLGQQRPILPVPDPLPSFMKGQSPSTIQAMLRNGWKPEDR